MKTQYETPEAVEINAGDFLGSYLKKEDLQGETRANIIAVRADEVPNSPRRKLVAEFAEFEKALILNSTNIKRLIELFGSKNTAKWRGVVTLYVDESVAYGGQVVGGVRIKAAAANGNGRDFS